MNIVMDGHKMTLGAHSNDLPELKSTMVCLRIGQQIVYNTVTQKKNTRICEIPFPLHIYIKSYLTKTAIVNILNKSGTRVSYKRVCSLATAIANSCISHWKQTYILGPRQVSIGAFTGTGLDSVNWNARSTLP